MAECLQLPPQATAHTRKNGAEQAQQVQAFSCRLVHCAWANVLGPSACISYPLEHKCLGQYRIDHTLCTVHPGICVCVL